MEVLVWKDVRITAVQKPQKLMGRHRPVSQTVIISFIPFIPGKLEGSAASCPRLFACSVAESKNQLSAVSS